MEVGKFLAWVLPKGTVVYKGDPLLIVEKLFPVDDLSQILGQSNDDRWLERELESVEWFRELIASSLRVS